MKKNKQRYGLRKLCVGVVSCLLGTMLYLSAETVVYADETSAVPTEETTNSTSASPISDAESEIADKGSVDVVPKEEAQSGDIVEVSVEDSGWNTTHTDLENGGYTDESTKTTTVKTKKKIDPEKLGNTETSESSTETKKTSKSEDDHYFYTITEKVIKKTSIGMSNEQLTEVEYIDVDMVFVIDVSGSMYSYYAKLTDQLTEFVAFLNERGVHARLGLTTFSDVTIGEESEYIQFGDSYFTTDVEEFKEAINVMNTKYGGDEPETPTPNLVHIANNYDWLDAEGAMRLAFVLTDASFKESEEEGIPTMASAIEALRANDIEVVVVTNSWNSSRYMDLAGGEEGLYDINSDFGELFKLGISEWIVDKLVNNIYVMETDTYEFYKLVEATPKPLPEPEHEEPEHEEEIAPMKQREIVQTDVQTSFNGFLALMMSSWVGLSLGLRKRKEQ